ncbi:MAG: hypothetical protein V3S97_05300 [Candidatus Bathyarchaeia archaeon]
MRPGLDSARAPEQGRVPDPHGEDGMRLEEGCRVRLRPPPASASLTCARSSHDKVMKRLGDPI